MTIDAFAAVSGLSRGFVSQLETGAREPSAETLELISQTLGIAVSDLVSDAGDALTRVQLAMRSMAAEDQEKLAAMAEALAAQSGR